MRSSAPSAAGERGRSSSAFLDARPRPRGMFVFEAVEQLELLGSPGVPERDDRVALQVAAVVARHVQPVVTSRQLVRVGGQPVRERDDGLSARLLAGAPLLDAAIPRADVLADVAAVDAVLERRAHLLRDRLRRLRPVGETKRRVERAGLVERAGRARVDAEPAGAAVELERRRRLDLDVGDERSEHDPRAEAFRDQERVLAVEADARACGALTVDVLVRVDEDAVLASERGAEPVELLAQLRVVVGPRVARQPSLSGTWLGTWSVVAERC